MAKKKKNNENVAEVQSRPRSQFNWDVMGPAKRFLETKCQQTEAMLRSGPIVLHDTLRRCCFSTGFCNILNEFTQIQLNTHV